MKSGSPTVIQYICIIHFKKNPFQTITFMQLRIITSAWWGPPKKFDPHFEKRSISWLELFYDLVYVIAISRITHHLAKHMSLEGFLQYACLFILIFWGWLNGSLYYDLHGNKGLRTRLMTLWQVMIIAALAITIDQPSPTWYVNTTIVFMIMQLFITYAWWSVGFYDKNHRRYSRPYTILFLVAFALMALSLYAPKAWLLSIGLVVIICNYLPPFIANVLLRRQSLVLNLSSSMAERLGLFTIIVFGEVVLGVVNGVSKVNNLNFSAWLNFAFAISIVFALWWIFFTLTSNRNAKTGFVVATFLELLCIPTLMSLGLIAARFSYLFDSNVTDQSLNIVFNCAVAAFLIGINLMMGLLEYHDIFRSIERPVRLSLLVTAMVLVGGSLVNFKLDTHYYLLVVLGVLVVEISCLNFLYYNLDVEERTRVENGLAETE
jgi:low temperature requirement protein LtrA